MKIKNKSNFISDFIIIILLILSVSFCISNIVCQCENNNLKKVIEKNQDTLKLKKLQIQNLEKNNKNLKEIENNFNILLNEYNGFNTKFPDSSYSQFKYVVKRLRNENFSTESIAGVMGNIMAEIGGNSFDISYWSVLAEEDCYGICQWMGVRKDRLLKDFGTSLKSQVDFMIVEMYEILGNNQELKNSDDCEKIALLIASKYEICNKKYYDIRITNSKKALKFIRENNL